MDLAPVEMDVPALVASVGPVVAPPVAWVPEEDHAAMMKTPSKLPHNPVFAPAVGMTMDGSMADSDVAALRGSAAAELEIDLFSALGWRGATVLGGAHGFVGDAPPGSWGAFQGLSNIDTDPGAGLGELYLRQHLGGDALRLSAGRIDANVDHAASDYGGGFLNPGLNATPTIAGIPTFPEPGLGVAAAAFDEGVVRPRAALFPALGGSFAIGQVAVATGSSGGQIAAGAWRHQVEGAAPARGGFAMIDQPLLFRGEDPALAAFALGGVGDPVASDFRGHAGGGLVVIGLPFGREADSLGLGASWVALAEAVPGGPAGEAVLEAFYKVAGSNHLDLTVDGQHLIQPGGAGGYAVTLRTELFL